MNQQNQQSDIKKKPEIIKPSIRIALVVSLAIISIFPFFITFAPQEWPPQRGVITVDIIYLFILAIYIPIITGWSRSKLLLAITVIISIVGVFSMTWLTATLATLDIG